MLQWMRFKTTSSVSFISFRLAAKLEEFITDCDAVSATFLNVLSARISVCVFEREDCRLCCVCREATTAALAKLNKSSAATMKSGEKKETPQERLKRIMSKQLTKQSKYLFGLSALTFDFEPT